ncbi:hypothetical protein PAEPH01_1028 [Pancytospora epiphaga]|nr:hypothetical protein PAEPH01_1028 [Pancytospora epiphaga]
MPTPETVYDITVTDYLKNRYKLLKYKGKVLLIVNVASGCGLARQAYANLCDLLVKYQRKGLCIMLFPCKQFLSQEFSDIQKVKEFVDKYNDNFILMDMVDVKGENMHPLFKLLCDNLKGWLTNSIKWNFTTFLIGRNGELVKRYGPTERIKASDPDLLKCIGNAKDEVENKPLTNFKNVSCEYIGDETTD